jgi:hypothetical protein
MENDSIETIDDAKVPMQGLLGMPRRFLHARRDE